MARFLGLPRNATGNLDLSTYTVLKSSCSGTAASTSLSATNASFTAGQRIFICQMRGTGAGNYEDNKISSYTAGTITLLHPLENTYTDSGASQAQVVVVPEAATSSGTLTVPAWDGDIGGLFVMAVSQADGTIVGTGKGFRGGAGHIKDDGTIGIQGESYSGTGTGSNSANNGGGGGGGQLNISSGHGGGGGYGTAGDTSTGGGLQHGIGGSTYGQVDLSTGVFLGSGGGGGYQDPTGSGGDGGDGGAIIVIYARELKSTLTVTNNGENGESSGYSGGSASGGTILIKCLRNLGATLSATGGVAISSSGGGLGQSGAGGDGRIRIEACSNTVGTEDPTASLSTGGHSYCGGVVSII